MEVLIVKGLLVALAINFTAWLFSEKVAGVLGTTAPGATDQEKTLFLDASCVYAETAVRFFLSALGVVGVLVALGPELGIPCAVWMVPLYLIGMMVCLRKRIRRIRKNRENTV